MRRRKHELNHSKVENYRVTYNEIYKDFLMSPDYIHEDNLLFVYKDGDTLVNKIIPVKEVMQHVKIRRFFEYDYDRAMRKFKGTAYEVSEDFVFKYKC